MLYEHAGDSFDRRDTRNLLSFKHPQLAVRIRILLEKSIRSTEISQPVLRKMHDWILNLVDIHALQIVVTMQELVVDSKWTLDIRYCQTGGLLLTVPVKGLCVGIDDSRV